ncbi:hypothetical protein, partial [Escherichia coli]|uniref:hypothetical protein n=1 Tax=Escherichia coli TaxID=562 RepID=UPI0021C97324
KKFIMLPSETMIWQPEFTDKTLSRKTGAVHCMASARKVEVDNINIPHSEHRGAITRQEYQPHE